MKHKTSELTGALLDAAVAKAQGLLPEIIPYRISGDMGITFVRDEPVCQVGVAHFEPSKAWSIGGPIIEREGINPFTYVYEGTTYWAAHMHGESPAPGGFGEKSLLIAAMRAYVAHKLGDEVEL